jgi:hypothetical protein
MCDKEESQEKFGEVTRASIKKRNGKATHGQVRQILELKLDSRRIP